MGHGAGSVPRIVKVRFLKLVAVASTVGLLSAVGWYRAAFKPTDWGPMQSITPQHIEDYAKAVAAIQYRNYPMTEEEKAIEAALEEFKSSQSEESKLEFFRLIYLREKKKMQQVHLQLRLGARGHEGVIYSDPQGNQLLITAQE